MIKILNLSKRQKFVIATVILAIGILLIRIPFLQWRFRVPLYAISSALLSLWAIRDEDFSGIEWLTLLILPVTFAISCALLFPLLPQTFLNFFLWEINSDTGLILGLGIKLVFILLFAIGYYACLLTNNILNVAAERTIQLLRAAHSVGFVLKLFCMLAIGLVISSMHLDGVVNLVLVAISSFPLIFVSLWTVNLDRKIEKRTIIYSAAISLCLGEIGWALSFLPISLSLFSLVLASVFYAVVGMGQMLFAERLTYSTAKEFILVLIVVFVILLGSIFIWPA